VAENIINRTLRAIDQGIGNLYNRDQIAALEAQYGMGATGKPSMARHMAAMNELSKSLSPMNNPVGNFVGDTLAFGAGLINEAPALARGLNAQNLSEIKEDIVDNFAGTFGTPNVTTAQQIFENVYSTPQNVQTAFSPTYGTVQAAMPPSVVDVPAVQAAISRARAQDFIDTRAETKNQSPTTFGLPDPTDRFGRAPVEEAFEMIGGRAVPVGDVLGRQMALEKADFVEETPTGLASLVQNINPLGLIAGLINPALGFAVNMGSRARSGLGSLGSKLADFREKTTGYRTQAGYEAARTARQQQKRTDRMIDRITRGKPTRSNPRDAGTTQAQKDAISAAMRESRRGQQYTDKDSSGSGGTGGGKVVCTMMNERYGFGSFRNKIWMKFHESYGPEYQKGYHAIFLPLVKIAKGEGKINTAVRKVLEHMGRHVTADMFKIMKGKKRDTLGRIYRAIFEPACHIIGKIKSALGRG
jgi:hypothetical protein